MGFEIRSRASLLSWATALLTAGEAAADGPPVPVVHAERGDVVRYVSLPGTIRANLQATLYAKVPGYLKSIRVDKGDSVKAGELLAEIEVPELLADLARYQAELVVAEADATRLAEAHAKAPDLVVPQRVDEAKGKLEIARANLDRTRTLLGFSRITAPFGGVVTMRFVDPGAFIPAATSGSAAQNAALLTLMDFDTVRVQVAVPESEASLVRTGQPLLASVDGLPGRTFSGHVTRQSWALDDATKTLLVEADLRNPSRELRPGMYASVRLGVQRHSGVVVVPSAALVTERAGSFVFRLEGGKARKTPAQAGFNDGSRVEVAGIAEGAAVLVPGKLALADGQAVTATEAK